MSIILNDLDDLYFYSYYFATSCVSVPVTLLGRCLVQLFYIPSFDLMIKLNEASRMDAHFTRSA